MGFHASARRTGPAGCTAATMTATVSNAHSDSPPRYHHS